MSGNTSRSRARPVTLADVAREAGVSVSTASRAMNGSAKARRVDEELKRRVLDAAERLHYTANLQAQAVARGTTTTTTMALLVSDIADAYFSSMVAAVMKAAEEYDLRVTVVVTERRVEREIEVVREFRAQHARAVVLAGSGYFNSPEIAALQHELELFESTGGRVVLVSRRDLRFETVDLDNHGGARRLSSALARLGYRRFLVLAGEEQLVATQDRVDGFRHGLQDKGLVLPDDHVMFSDFSWEGANQVVQTLDDEVLAATELIFAVNDEMALGAIAGLRSRGMRIPDDIAVAGFDDIRTLRDIMPGLTTVHVPLDEVGREVVARVVEGSPGARPRTLPANVVLRESTPRRN